MSECVCASQCVCMCACVICYPAHVYTHVKIGGLAGAGVSVACSWNTFPWLLSRPVPNTSGPVFLPARGVFEASVWARSLGGPQDQTRSTIRPSGSTLSKDFLWRHTKLSPLTRDGPLMKTHTHTRKHTTHTHTHTHKHTKPLCTHMCIHTKANQTSISIFAAISHWHTQTHAYFPCILAPGFLLDKNSNTHTHIHTCVCVCVCVCVYRDYSTCCFLISLHLWVRDVVSSLSHPVCESVISLQWDCKAS